MQEKLEKSWTLLRATTQKIEIHFSKMNFNSNVAACSKVQLFSAKQSKNRSEEKLDCAIGLKTPLSYNSF